MPKSRKAKRLPDDKFRVIKISKQAIFEFIYESVIDHQKIFFDLISELTVTSHHDINFENGEFITLVCNSDESKGSLDLPDEIDLQKLMSRMKDTTNSMFVPNRYVDLSLDEIIAIQSGKDSPYAKDDSQV